MKKAYVDFSLKDIILQDEYEKNAFNLEMKYLKSLNPDRLLRGFYDISGKESKYPLYGGWETSAIQGHTLGHYLSAVSRAYCTTQDKELLNISDHIVSCLNYCQNKDTGYLAAIPESHYDKIALGDTKGTWVPWYSLHKILSGIIDAYLFTENPEALKVASSLGDWVYSHTSKWNEETQKRVLSVEYGGMNDCLYQLYSITKKDEHLFAAHTFDETDLFDQLYNNEDILNGKHANTTIPKIIGALRRYIVTDKKDAYYLKVAEIFWDIVINNHTYITGGNSEWEHFHESNVLDARRTNCNCETCNTYNMLKLSRELFKVTGKVKYAHYYENTFINAILSSQNPETGMTTYFQPMATGFFKVYSSPEDHFWCCTGSGMESFSKLNDSICYKSADSICFIRYTSCDVHWKEKGIKIIQKTELPKVKFTIYGEGEAKIILRVPDWCDGNPELKINGKEITVEPVDGFICVSRQWNNSDTIEFNVPMKVCAYPLADNKNVAGFKYGPYVLSADMGDKNMKTGITGVNVTIPLEDDSVNEEITVPCSVEEWLKNAHQSFIPTKEPYTFTLKTDDRELLFSPHFRQYKKRYGIYFKFKNR